MVRHITQTVSTRRPTTRWDLADGQEADPHQNQEVHAGDLHGCCQAVGSDSSTEGDISSQQPERVTCDEEEGQLCPQCGQVEQGRQEEVIASQLMSHGAQFVFYLIAFIAFVVAAVLAWLTKAVWATLIAAGAALVMFVAMWNQLALS